MDECKCTLSKRLTGDGCRYCQPQEYIDRLGEWLDEERADIDAKDANIERLNALVAMQDEALNEAIELADALVESMDYLGTGTSYKEANEERSIDEEKVQRLRNTLSATADTVSAWQSKRDNEIRANALEDADVCPDCFRKKAHNVDDCLKGHCAKWYAIRDKECAEECAKLAELRAKGE